MARPPISLNALVTTEAVLRRSSVLLAARELGVTPAAVSQQVKQLESQLGVELLERHSRGVRPTEAGARLLPELSRAFEQLDFGLSKIGPSRRSRRVAISALPAFTQLVLLPRIDEFRHRHPEIELLLRSGRSFSDLDSEGVDLAIRYCLHPGATAWSKCLGNEQVFPVAHPRFLPSDARSPSLMDLAEAPLLHDVDAEPHQREIGWDHWFARHDRRRASPNDLYFDDSAALLSAAKQGLGIALGRSVLVASALARGELVRLGEGEVATARSYYVLASRRKIRRPEVRLVADWIATLIPRAPTSS